MKIGTYVPVGLAPTMSDPAQLRNFVVIYRSVYIYIYIYTYLARSSHTVFVARRARCPTGSAAGACRGPFRREEKT